MSSGKNSARPQRRSLGQPCPRVQQHSSLGEPTLPHLRIHLQLTPVPRVASPLPLMHLAKLLVNLGRHRLAVDALDATDPLLYPSVRIDDEFKLL